MALAPPPSPNPPQSHDHSMPLHIPKCPRGTKSPWLRTTAEDYQRICIQFLLFIIVIFYKVIGNTALMNTEPLLLGEIEG